MTKKMKTLLEEEYVATLQDLKESRENQEEAKWNLNKLAKLHELVISADETALKKKDIWERRKDRVTKTAVDILGIGVPVIVECYWLAEGLEFEKTGTFIAKTPKWVSSIMTLFRKK